MASLYKRIIFIVLGVAILANVLITVVAVGRAISHHVKARKLDAIRRSSTMQSTSSQDLGAASIVCSVQ